MVEAVCKIAKDPAKLVEAHEAFSGELLGLSEAGQDGVTMDNFIPW